MLTTMHEFLLFFFPMLTLIFLGIIFEEKLVAFESRVFAFLFQKAPAQKKAAPVTPSAPAVRRVERPVRRVRPDDHRAA